ncbi:uncharacterized protein LOC108090299 [Drosophila ficusphila]|uniref:uncharacterized protein LOC108090299 n=1 Tax=Drosophila ficusphila TaxID=30025 RepID=UPI0007E813A3|nr:uncharacterized protein LOC108090299 [Drosophila ficusphila]
MKLCFLVVLFCQIFLETNGREEQLAYRNCEGTLNRDCFEYCHKGCHGPKETCLHRCENGCGCREGAIFENNGGCRRIKKCEDDEKDSASVENQDYAGDYVTDWWQDLEPIIVKALKEQPNAFPQIHVSDPETQKEVEKAIEDNVSVKDMTEK